MRMCRIACAAIARRCERFSNSRRSLPAGVEYIIPYTIHGADQPAPVLFGQQFMKNDHFQLRGLHAWVGKNNLSGTFAMWNPDVSCQFAPAS